MPASADFSGLSAEERQSLMAWRLMAAERGLGPVIDMTERNWKLPDARTILGIFQLGQDRAACLVVQEQTGWSLIDCEKETIVGGILSLKDALALVIP